MDIFIDIGFTLLGGTEKSPPKAICNALNFNKLQYEILYDIVFCENHTSPETLVESISRKLNVQFQKFEIGMIREIWNKQYRTTYELDGATYLIECLARRKNHYRIHLASNLWFPFYEVFIRHFKANAKKFSTETLSFIEGIRKPSIKFYELALKKADAKVENSIMIGDSLDNDILPCAKMGIKSIWYDSRPSEKSKENELLLDSQSLKNVYKIKNLVEAIEVINNIECR
jgi:HAD superfamily hydrolase (TIGR01549 family)